MASSAPGAPARGSRRSGGSRRRGSTWVTALGLVMLLAGLSILGWAGWQFLGTNWTAGRQAGARTQSLQQQWQRPVDRKHPRVAAPGGDWRASGQPVALLRIPALGDDWQYPVLVGTTPEVLSGGVGWYPETARAGQVGNFALAGHRVTHGEPFRRLLQLQRGDTVVVETRDAVFTYQLDDSPAQLTVTDVDGGWVLDPVPGKPAGTRPTRKLLTLTTCADLFHSPNRSVAFAHLVAQRRK